MSPLTISLSALSLLAALAMPARLAAQEQAAAAPSKATAPHYLVTDLGTLGGTYSFPGGIDNEGLVNGTSTLPGDADQHAVLWVPWQAKPVDLQTLGGPNSGSLFGVNLVGQVAGAAETSGLNPYGYEFCSFLGFSDTHNCLPFIWQNGVMTTLPTLGGLNGAAQQANNFGLIAGGVENTRLDPSCLPAMVFEQTPVLWQGGKAHALSLIPGDVNGFAFSINDLGQTVGYSGAGLCASLTSQIAHNVLWQNGAAVTIDLSKLPGGASGLPSQINNRGQVVGFSGVPPGVGGEAYLWENGRTKGLGVVYGTSSAAFGVNITGQIVGQSCVDSSGECHAFLWQDGTMTDLTNSIPGAVAAVGINDLGQIAGALVTSGGELHAFLATPRNRSFAGESDSSAASVVASPMHLSENVRKLLRGRFGTRGR